MPYLQLGVIAPGSFVKYAELQYELFYEGTLPASCTHQPVLH